MKKRILSAVLGIWLTLMTIMPANVMLASTVGGDVQTRTPDVQCETKPGTPVIPCVTTNNVSWNS